MKLHLHIGAHKTATTHFQNVLLRNRVLYEQDTCYVPIEEFREHVTEAARLLKPSCGQAIREYLSTLERIDKQTLIISEENLLGEAKDIYCSKQLYCNMGKRLSGLRMFVSSFSDATIWISIRSMDTFLPSLYCESLLHWKSSRRVRRFGQVLAGQHEQSWIPVIRSLHENFPDARINVVPYETYGAVLPQWLEAMTGVQAGWDLLETERPRASMAYLPLQIMNYAKPFIGSDKAHDFIQNMVWRFFKKGRGGKYSPFDDSTQSRFRSLYMQDLEKIENMGAGIHLFKGCSLL